jgi:hypothetical protein
MGIILSLYPSLIALGLMVMADMGAGPPEPALPDQQAPFLAERVNQAKEDLARRLSVETDQIDLLEARQVTWPDSSLGCPKPGMVYAQALQEGLLIRLGVAVRMYFYHSGGDQDPFLCEQTSRQVPSITPLSDEWLPPPGSKTD